jgi:CHAD domain-containing protein
MARKARDQFPLLKRADGLVTDFRRLVPRAVKASDESSIHDTRVVTRRLKAVLDVFEPILTGEHRKSFGRVLRKLRRRLGPLRDLDVILGHLGSFPARHRAGVGWIGERLKARREEFRRSALRQISPPKLLGRLGAWWVVREELVAGQASINILLAESLRVQLAAFAEKADALVDDPHALRIAGKAVRYSLEMAIVQRHSLPAAITRSFKQMQDALGQWHDYVVLAERIMQLSLDEHLSHHDAAMAAAVMEITRTAVQRSSRQLMHFRALWLARGRDIVATINEAFPLPSPPPSTAVSESETDRDLSGSEETGPGRDAAQGEISAA